MCGIFGRYSWDGDIGPAEALRLATDSLRHRGPDGTGYWVDQAFFFGHTRLSIIDIDRGGQPLHTLDQSFSIVFNGEIYNYVELRAELVSLGNTFSTDSDTEVILLGYRQWRENVCARLVGMFAFAIADRLDQSLFLARDRFGEKPLFLSRTLGSVTFASEVKAFRKLTEYSGKISATALTDFLCLNYVSGRHTLAEGVDRLLPGTWQRYSRDGFQEATYWVAPKEQCTPVPCFEFAAATVQELLDQSVCIALRSDVPVAVYLSGGIDSSLIAESAVRQGKIQDAFCLDFPEASHSEWANASHVAKQLGLRLHRVELTSQSLGDFFEFARHMDDPLGDSSALALYTLSKQVSNSYKVVLTGDGGDELFGGYLTYRASSIHRFLHRLTPKVLLRLLAYVGTTIPVGTGKVSTSYKLHRFLRAFPLPPAEAHLSWNGSWLPSDVIRFIGKNILGECTPNLALTRIVTRHQISTYPTLRDLQILDTREYLANDILAKVDRSTMAFGLESRSPFLDHRLAGYALALPSRYHLSVFGESKRILRRLAEGKFGRRISHARKQGFSIPVHMWLRNGGREILETILSKDNLDKHPCLDTNEILLAKQQHLSGQAQLGFELWGLMILVNWLEHYSDH
jgi:asparagine synthase (glutamine-hydrolysing)